MHVRFFLFFLFFSIKTIAQPTSDEQLATHYFQSGQFDKAAIYYEKLYKENPNEIFYEYCLKSYIEIKAFKEAEKMVKKRIKNSVNPKYQVDLGVLYEKAQEEKKAKDAFDILIKKLEPDASLIIQTANAFLMYDKKDLALETYLKGRKILKGGYPLNIELAELYQSMSNYELMIAEYLDLLMISEAYIQTVQNSLNNSNSFEKSSKQNEILKRELLKYSQKYSDQKIFSEMLIWVYLQQSDFPMAMLQSKAIDKRFKEDGTRVIQVSEAAYSNEDYSTAIEGYEYVIAKGKNNEYYQEARSQQLAVMKDKITKTGVYTQQDLENLETNYKLVLKDIQNSYNSIGLLRNLASIQALYLNKLDTAIANLEKALKLPSDKQNTALCKLDLGDYLLLKNEIWDASLYYSQVEKEFKYDEIGERAKFKNAKVSYYTGDFKWAKAQLDVLKGSTSKLIANDALWLSVLITDNTTIDTNEVPLKMFSQADLLAYQNKMEEATQKLDSILVLFPEHSLQDDIYYQKYTIAFKKKDFQGAISFLNKIISQFPDDILADNALFKLGELYEKTILDKEKAMEQYQKLMSTYPGSLNIVEARKRFRILRGDVVN